MSAPADNDTASTRSPLGLKTVLKQVPGLQSTKNRALRRLADARCSVLRRFITARGNYDVLVLLGMRRSGNHLAINWIMNQTDGSAVFYNNVRVGAHPYSARQKEAFLHRPLQRSRLVLSYEDQTLDDMLSGPLATFLEDHRDRPGVRLSFGIILRDPYNLFASRLKKWPERFDTADDIAAQRRLYIEHAALACEARSVLDGVPVIPILYNRLVSSADYRSNLSARLNIRDGLKGLDQVPTYGHGSSFDGMHRSGNDLQSSVFNRWEKSRNEPAFAQAVNDPKVQQVAKEVFDIHLSFR